MKLQREVLLSLGPKKKIKNLHRASKPRTAESKALRRQPGGFSAGTAGASAVRLLVVRCRHTRIKGHTHFHTQTHTPARGRFLLDYTADVKLHFPQGFVLMLNQIPLLLWGVG